MSSPVEVTTRYVTTVDDLPEAWAFIMGHLDTVGPDPTIQIKPLWIISAGDIGEDQERPPRQFEVLVEGMVEAT
jgi:hypothetical protein